MKNNNSNEKNIETERKKIIRKEINTFLNNNFKWFIALAVIIILISGFFFLLKPKHEETLKLVRIISEQEGLDLEAKQKELEEIRDFLQSYSEVEERYIKKINSIAPPRQNKEELFTEFNYIISRNGLSLQTIDIGGGGEGKKESPVQAGNKLNQVSVRLKVRGTDYRAFKNFLSVLENNLQLMDITNINFQPSSESTEMTINTYYLD